MERWYCETAGREVMAHWIEELPLEDWRIDLRVESLDDSEGSVSVAAEYRDAVIRVDHERIPDRKRLAQTVKHEMMHVLTGEFQTFWDIIKDEIPDDRRSLAARAFDACWELVVRRLERCWPEDE